KAVKRLPQSVLGNGQSDMLRGDAFQRVRLIEDDKVIWIKKTALVRFVGILVAEEGEKQGMVQHHHLRGLGASLSALVEAVGRLSARALRADMALAAHLHPDLRIGFDGEIAERPLAGRFAPLPDAFEFLALGIREKVPGVLNGALKTMRAKVV